MGGDDEKDKLYKIIGFWMVISMGGSTAISTGVQKFDTNTRADPFTGAQGRQLESRIRNIERVVDRQVARNTDILGEVKKTLDKIHEHIEEHDSESEQWKRRIIHNEHEIQRLKGR